MNMPTKNKSLLGLDDTTAVAAKKQDRRNREIVLQTIKDLCEHGLLASRIRVKEVSCLKQTIVDDHVARLKTDGQIRSLYNGVYEHVDQTMDRAVSTTALPGGRMKVEIGDDVIFAMTPREQVALAKQLAGLLFMFAGLPGR